jgi:hypothetical protein
VSWDSYNVEGSFLKLFSLKSLSILPFNLIQYSMSFQKPIKSFYLPFSSQGQKQLFIQYKVLIRIMPCSMDTAPIHSQPCEPHHAGTIMPLNSIHKLFPSSNRKD